MKKKPITSKITKTYILLLTFFMAFSFQSDAQSCLVNQLDFSTGQAVTNPGSMLGVGQTEPRWLVSTSSQIYGPLSSASPVTVTPSGTWGNNGADWISVNQAAVNNDSCATNEEVFYTRTIHICEGGTYYFDMNILVDNYILTVILNDVNNSTSYMMYSNATGPINQQSNYTNGTVIQKTYTLAAGTYTIEVEAGNFGVTGGVVNPFGIAIAGSVKETNSKVSIVNDLNPDCNNYVCSNCSEDTCFWKVTGNQIHSGNNTFGTLSNDDVKIVTNNTSRGILTSSGLWGWNTSNPSAFLHVNCIGNNSDDGSNGSDVRFEGLEPGSGSILAIDDNTGYVYNTGIPAGVSSTDWHTVGNTANTSDYIGTNNNIDFRFYTNFQERMRIKNQGQDFDAGFVGINTTSPTARLHVNCNNGNDIQNPGIFQNSDVRFEGLETGTGSILSIDPDGYVYNTGIDVSTIGGKNWQLTGNNATPTDYIGTNNDEDLRLYTRGTQKMIIKGIAAAPAEEGFVGINTPLPTARLHVDCNSGNGANGNGNGFSDIRFENLEDGDGQYLVIDKNGYVYKSTNADVGGIQAICSQQDMVSKFDANGNLDCSVIYDDGQSVSIGTGPGNNFSYSLPGPTQYGGPNSISSTGTVTLDVAGVTRATSYLATSDARFKAGIKSIDNSMELINGLQGKSYNWNELAKKQINADGGRHYGFIAQEVEKVVPEAVIKDAKGNYAVDYNAFIPILTESQKELYKMYQEEKAKNQQLETKLSSLEARLAALESHTSTNDIMPDNNTSNILYQNTPNPFGNETVIRYKINVMNQSAYIVVYDLNGREIAKYPVEKGDGKVVVSSSKLIPGMYLYSLVVDGHADATKRMVFTDN